MAIRVDGFAPSLADLIGNIECKRMSILDGFNGRHVRKDGEGRDIVAIEGNDDCRRVEAGRRHNFHAREGR